MIKNQVSELLAIRLAVDMTTPPLVGRYKLGRSGSLAPTCFGHLNRRSQLPKGVPATGGGTASSGIEPAVPPETQPRATPPHVGDIAGTAAAWASRAD